MDTGESSFSGGPNNTPFNADMFEDIKKASADAFQSQADAAKKSGKVVDGVADDIAKSFRRAAINSAASMDSFLKNTEQATERAQRGLVSYGETASKMLKLHNEAAKKSQEQLKEHAKKTEEQLGLSATATSVTMNEMLAAWTAKVTHQEKLITSLNEKSHSLSSSMKGKSKNPFDDSIDHVSKLSAFSSEEIMGQITQRAGANVMSGGLEQITGLLGKIGPMLVELLPQVMAFTSVVGIVGAIAKEFWELDALSAKMRNEVGGNADVVDKYIARMNGLTTIAHKSNEELFEMGEAFEKVGLKITEGEHGLDDYMVLGAEFNRVLGLSNEQIAEIVKAQTAAGISAKDTKNTYSEMYQTMQSLGLTLGDLKEALTEGTSEWKNYGAMSGSSLSAVQDDVTQTMGLFRAFNLDIKSVGNSLESLSGDPRKQRKQAIFVSQMMGISAQEARVMQKMDPAGFQQQLLQSEGNFLTQNKNSAWGLGRSQMEGMSTQQKDSIFENREMQLRMGVGASGMDRREVVQLMNNYQSYAAEHSGASFDDFMRDRIREQKSKEASGSLDQSLNALNSSGHEMVDNAGRDIGKFVRQIALGVNEIAKKIVPGYQGVEIGGGGGGGHASKPEVPVPGHAGGNWFEQPAYGAVLPSSRVMPSPPAITSSVPAPPIASSLHTSGGSGRVDIGNGFWLSGAAGESFKAAQAEAAKNGVHLKVNEAGRTFEHQQYLYNNRGTKGISPTVALPGHSNHEVGNALDIQNYQAALPYLVKHGFVHGDGRGKIANDPWHFKYVGGGKGSAIASAGHTSHGIDIPAPGPGLSIQPPRQLTEAEYNAMIAKSQIIPPIPGGAAALAAAHLAEQKRTNELLAKANEHHEETKQTAKESAEQKRRLAMAGTSNNTTSNDMLNRRI